MKIAAKQYFEVIKNATSLNCVSPEKQHVLYFATPEK